VRNNQRRCRARRKAYITELETKIDEHEKEHCQEPMRAELLGAQKEIESLKRLLNALGLDEGFLETFNRAQRLTPILAGNQGSNVDLSSLPEPSLRPLTALPMSEVGCFTIIVIAI
jgi:hypothetical protein